MCGVAGFIDLKRQTPQADLEALAGKMAATLQHRGPDDSGVWADEAAGIALGHQRLSIIDLSAAGHQPMASASGRFILCYNGEVYNAGELRAELQAAGHMFRGHSDTEVIAEGCDAWGLSALLPRLIGMFALALWDREKRELTLARDRLGIKPMYWGHAGDALLFGSELKSLRAHPAFDADIDRDALVSLLRHNYVRGPHSIYQGIQKLAPGHLAVFFGETSEPKVEPFWDLAPLAQTQETDMGSEDESLGALESLLRDAVKRRMVADVPLGAFLSGGIDSSTVVALMQAQSDRPVRTFTIGFNEPGYNEAEHAKAVAAHLGTDHTELYVDPALGRDVIPRLPEYFDEPFADASQIPTFLVSELTRRHVTVALSGDGGDEVFAGYTRYLWADAIWDRLRLLPRGVRHGASVGLRALSPRTWDSLLRAAPARLRPPQAGERIHKMAHILPRDSIDNVYRSLISQWQDPACAVVGGTEPGGPIWDDNLANAIPDPIARMQYLDTITYLPDDILTKVDRASMAVSLEARVPLLDHRVVEFAWRMPQEMKTRNRQGKWPLRRSFTSTFRRKWSNAPSRASPCRSAIGCAGRCAIGPKTCCPNAVCARTDFFNPGPCARCGRNTSRAGATGSISYGGP